MAPGNDAPQVYQALVLPEQALEKGGREFLRAGMIGDDLYVSALPVFASPGRWGEVLADIARRVGAIYGAHGQGISRHDATVQIAEAFAAAMGAKPVKAAPAARARKPVRKAKAAAKKAKVAKKASNPSARKKR